jgi:DnaJ-class molecular chaperone
VRCYLLMPVAEDPQQLLDPDLQLTAPWRSSEESERCDKCRGSGRTGYECWSCRLTGTDSSCPACRGRVRWEAECPLCRGTGKADTEPRAGVSAFPTAEALYRHRLTNQGEVAGMLVQLEAEPADDLDFYADQGSLLVIPTTVESTRPIEPEAIETIKRLARQ